MRSFDRTVNQPRPLSFDLHYTRHADGSVLIGFGHTKVICTAFLEEKVPPFLRNQKRGWATAEYGMLPGSTHSRCTREATRGKRSGRSLEISRLIGRALRTCLDMKALGERTVTVDCDVIQADGGTRTAAITGACLAMILCLWKHREKFPTPPIHTRVAAISMGIVEDRILVDLDYAEDSSAQVDLNLALTGDARIIEIQGTAEKEPFTHQQLNKMLEQGSLAITGIHQRVGQALSESGVAATWVP